MNFTEAVTSVFTNYATFSGRARRSEYWYFFLFNFIVNLVLNTLSRLTHGSAIIAIISVIYSLAVLVPSLAVVWRRLHDLGKSGAYFFFIFIPLAGPFILLYWLCQDSQPGESEYGPNPKGN